MHEAPSAATGSTPRARAGVQAVAVAVPRALRQGLRHAGVELHARLGLLVRAPGPRAGGLGEQVVVLRVAVGLARAGQAFELELAHSARALGQRELEGLLHLRRQRGQVLVHQLFAAPRWQWRSAPACRASAIAMAGAQ